MGSNPPNPDNRINGLPSIELKIITKSLRFFRDCAWENMALAG
jgi:hypothetical protein